MSVTQGIVVCHLGCIPKYQSGTEYIKTYKLHCYPVYQTVTQGIAPLILECIPEYQSATSIWKPFNYHCTPMSVSNAGYRGLSPGLYTGISVRDKVYEDLSATLFPCVSVSNPGYNGLSPRMFLEYRSVTKYMKTCQILCTPEYHSVYQSIMQDMEGLEFMLECQHIYTYCLKHCYLWKVMFSDDCLKNKSVLRVLWLNKIMIKGLLCQCWVWQLECTPCPHHLPPPHTHTHIHHSTRKASSCSNKIYYVNFEDSLFISKLDKEELKALH